ncbi:hypothetical protein PAXINDRAFT_19532 [Paxillus involutus ATCC 200175]|uniref:Uncharacterized protein n=1 Tax=Paxillus involutus ATCC 200175 TaxID=664439 RepID=A0A0C9TIX8_PAXIN|nr:hypothetical protein PAXINDRAFT_19532 [Paxillus involutus ATCC 200175]
MSSNTTERRTRASNATRHPGAIVLEAQIKRRTKAEIAADNETQRQAQATSDAVSKAVLVRIATLETEMEAKKTQVLSSKPSATRPKPKVRTRTKIQAEDTIPEAVEAPGDGQAEGAHVAGPVEDPVATEVEEFDEDESEDGEANDGMQRRVSRRPVKSSFRERVNDTHRMLDQLPKNGHEEIHAARSQTAALTESTLYFLNITSNRSTTKASLTGLVRNWASAVVPPASSKGTPSRALTGSNTGIRSKPRSTTTYTSGALIPLTPANSVVDTSSFCIAGLGEGEDDIYEHPVGIKGDVNLKGKDARKSLVSIAGDEDDNIMLPLSQSIKQSQRSTSTTSKLKRKASDTISLSSESGEEFELDHTGIDGPTMGIDSDIEIVDADSGVDHDEASTYHAPPKFKKSVERSIRTTDSTVVKLSESKAPLVKKVKTDVKVKTEPLESTVPSGSGRLPKTEGVVKPRSAYRKEDLPGFVLSDPQGRWHKKFLPTLILLLGSVSNPFDLPESSLVQFAQSTFHIVYPEVRDFAIASTGPIIAKILQRFCEWRSNFGSTAIALILDFMAHDKTRDPVEVATAMLEDRRFLYEDMQFPQKHEIYRSTFIITLLGSVHLTAVQGHAAVPSLKTDELAYSGMQGAVGMSSAAVERALTLIQKGHIDVDKSLKSIKGGKLSITLPKSLNKYTGKQTSAPYLFSDQHWGRAVRSYAHSLSTRGDDYIHDIIQLARETVRGTGVLSLSTEVGSDEPEEFDERAYLCE